VAGDDHFGKKKKKKKPIQLSGTRKSRFVRAADRGTWKTERALSKLMTLRLFYPSAKIAPLARE
jgi:hypothetical protein